MNRYLLFTGLAILMLLLTSCSASSESDWRFTGDELELLILDIDLPPGWKLWRLSQEPFPKGEDLGAVYQATRPDKFGINSVITHNITVFNEVKDAKKALEADYDFQFELTSEAVEAAGLSGKDFTPPQKHSYNSSIADEFRVIYAPETALTGQLVGYSYTVWARYGNVISWFVTIVADEEQTGIGPDEANVLSWPQTERLLKLIDTRFQEAGVKP